MAKPAEGMTYINFYAPQDLRTTLEEQAAKEGRSLSNFICRFLEEHLVQAIPGPAETPKPTTKQANGCKEAAR